MTEADVQIEQLRAHAEQLSKVAHALLDRVETIPGGQSLDILVDALDKEPESVTLADIEARLPGFVAAIAVVVASLNARELADVDRIKTIATQLMGLFTKTGEIDARLAAVEQRIAKLDS